MSLLNGSLSRWFDKLTAHDGEWRTVFHFTVFSTTGGRLHEFPLSKVFSICKGWPHHPLSLGDRSLHWTVGSLLNLNLTSWVSLSMPSFTCL